MEEIKLGTLRDDIAVYATYHENNSLQLRTDGKIIILTENEEADLYTLMSKRKHQKSI